MRRYAIVGGGIAGLSAAEAIRGADPGAEITLIGAEAHPFYSRPGLAYLLAGEIPESQLAVRGRAELRALALDRIVDEVTAIDLEARTVRLARHDAVRWDRLLLATGSAAIAPDLPGAALDGVVQLDSLDDARRILRHARPGRTAVVVGGGPTAVELVEGLLARGLRVHYLLRGGRYYAEVLDVVESRLVEEALEHEGARLHRHTRLARIRGQGGNVAAVETTTGEVLPCELVAVAIGVRPRVELARAAGLRVDRGVVVDPLLRTSASDVFAAGDVAQAAEVDRVEALWSSAVVEGVAAGRAMAGATAPFVRRPSLNVTRLGGHTITIVGAVRARELDAEGDLLTVSRGDSEGWRAAPGAWTFQRRDGATRVRALVGERHVVGAVVIGDALASRALARLVRERVDLTAIRAELAARPDQAVERLLRFAAAPSDHGGLRAPGA